jgi:hypothetical protein
MSENPGHAPELNQMSPAYLFAKRRVVMKKILLLHLLVYACVNSFLFVIDILTGSGLWFYWALLGWGIALAVHAVVYWSISTKGFLSPEWEARMIERELQRHS